MISLRCVLPEQAATDPRVVAIYHVDKPQPLPIAHNNKDLLGLTV